MRWLIARSRALITDDGELGTGALTLCGTDFDVDGLDALGGCDEETSVNFERKFVNTKFQIFSEKYILFDFGVFFKSLRSDGFDADDGLFKYFDTDPLRFFKCLLGECNGNLMGVLSGVDLALFFVGD